MSLDKAGGWAEGTPLRLGKRSGVQKTPDRREGGRTREAWPFEIRVPPPEFRTSSSAETPMSIEKAGGSAGKDSGSKSPRANSPDSPSHRPRGPMERGGEPVSRTGKPLPGANHAPKRHAEGADLRRGPPSRVLPLRCLAIPLDQRTRRVRGGDGPGFSIGCRSLGSAPIENPRPS